MVDTFTYAGDIAKRIAKCISDSALSVPQLSGQTGIPEATLRSRLSGAREFTFTEIALLANALGVKPTNLLPKELS